MRRVRFKRVRVDVSIHAFRGEGDIRVIVSMQTPTGFQSTPSGGKATPTLGYCCERVRFQSTPSGGKATLLRHPSVRGRRVSIHAFRGEGDRLDYADSKGLARFNPRLPGGRRHFWGFSGRGDGDVSIHAFRGEGDERRINEERRKRGVSIHAFRGEGDGDG